MAKKDQTANNADEINENENAENETSTEEKAAEDVARDAEEIANEDAPETEENSDDAAGEEAKEAEPLSEEEETFKIQLQRLQAEFMNFKKRTEREKFELSTFVKAEFTKRFLPVVDDINRLKENVDADEKTMKDALKLVFSKVDKFFEDEKIATVAAVGDEFDPNLHEALMQQSVEDEKDDDKVLNVFEQGYKIDEKIIRFAKVQVGKKA